MNHPIAALILLTILVSGCSIETLPSQSNPSCSWGSQVPANHDALCKAAFTTLRNVVNAVVARDVHTIHRLVPVPRIAQRIIATGNSWRSQGVHNLHVVPSLTLSLSRPGILGAGFYILGKNGGGVVKAPQTVYMQVRGSAGRIVGDEMGEEW